MNEFKFGDLVSYEEHEECGLGVVLNKGVYFENGKIYNFDWIKNKLFLVGGRQEWTKFDITAQETWPPFGEFVLAISKSDNDISQLSRFSKKGKFMISANCDDEAYYEEELIVTHWMPLPEPPKELS